MVSTTSLRQALLGDDRAASERQLALQEETSALLVPYGDVGPTKPKLMLGFTKNLKYRTVGGQQLEADCMFCGVWPTLVQHRCLPLC